MELSVVLCDDAYITELNREHRGKAAPTDVLSFPATDWDFIIADAPLALGDVVISLNTAERQATEQGYASFALLCSCSNRHPHGIPNIQQDYLAICSKHAWHAD